MNWLSAETSHYSFHFTRLSPLSQEDFDFHEQNLARETECLRVSAPRLKIHYYFYPDKNSMKLLTTFDGNAIAQLSGDPADPKTHFEIHSIYPRDNHEIIHVLLFSLGLPFPFWAEGIAVFRSGSWHGQSLTSAAERLLEKVLTLETLLDPQYFMSHQDICYPLAGAFIQFLVQTHGIEKFIASYQSIAEQGDRISPSYFGEIITAIYQKSFKILETEFRNSLRNDS